jgi:hypothetical protein
MYLLPFTCGYCGKATTQPAGAVNRARRIGAKLFCNLTCSVLARRKPKTKEQKVEEKRLYDAEYRQKNLARLKAEKRAYYAENHDREKEAAYRKANMHKHVEYCRRPEYRAKKAVYDLDRRAAEYGEFAEAYKLTLAVDREVKSRMSRYEIYAANGTLNKKLQRTRLYGS